MPISSKPGLPCSTPSIKRSKAAFTLIEMLAVCFLLSLTLSLSIEFLIPAIRASTRGSIRVDLQQEAIHALSSLCSEMQRSSPSGISLNSSTNPIAVAVCPLSRPASRAGEPAPVQPNGTLVWSSFFSLYYVEPASGEFRLQEWPPVGASAMLNPTAAESDTARPRRLDPLRLRQVIASGQAAPFSVLARGVRKFQILYPTGGTDLLYIQPVTFRLTLGRTGNTGETQEQRFIYSRTVSVCNERT